MSKTKDTATYTKCPECGWWLKPADDHCADCGRLRRQPVDTVGDRVGGIVGLFVGLFVGLLGLLVSSTLAGSIDRIITGVGSIFLGIFLGFSTRDSIANRIKARLRAAQAAHPPLHAPTSLRQREADLAGRVREFEKDQEDLQSLRQRIADRLKDLNQQGQPVGDLPSALRTLEEALAARAQQIQRYQVTSHGFDLVRWRNQLEPLLADLPQVDPDAVSPLIQQAQKHLSALEREGLIDTPKGNRLAAQWQQEIENCEALVNDLLAYQALRKAQDVEPLKEDALRDDLEQYLDAFSQREYLGELETELLGLEDEPQRLTGEEEALAEVENLLR